MRQAMEFEWAFSLFVRGEALMQTLPRHPKREANTISYVSDYLTRSVRRASGFVPVGNPEVIAEPRFPEGKSAPSVLQRFVSRSRNGLLGRQGSSE